MQTSLEAQLNSVLGLHLCGEVTPGVGSGGTVVGVDLAGKLKAAGHPKSVTPLVKR